MDQAPNHPTITTNGVLRPSYITVNLSRICENYQAIQKKVGQAVVMPILKANAYGHGLVEVGRYLEDAGAKYFGVAFLEEGLLLRESGIKTPILVLGGILGEQVPLFVKNGLALTASSIEKLTQVDQIAGALGVRAKVHLKIDTGIALLQRRIFSGSIFEM
jgi:alanine racemase